MSNTVLPTPEAVLRMCAATAPEPWFPGEFAQANQLARESFDPILNTLRVAGLIEIADWVRGRGQGYLLTPAGANLLTSPAKLARLNAGKSVPHTDPQSVTVTTPPSPNSANAMTHFERGERLRYALLTKRRPDAVRALILINCLVFAWGIGLAMSRGIPLNQYLYNSNIGVLVETGAISGELLVDGQWWRLLTACFVHIGLMHLAVNMYSLWIVGPIAEQLWGRNRFVWLYLLAGLGGSWAAMIAKPATLMAGASGAIWGVLASMIGWLIFNREHLPPQLIRSWLRSLLTVLILNTFISFLPGISAAGHFGGGLTGIFVAWLMTRAEFDRYLRRIAANIVLILLPVTFIVSLVVVMQRSEEWAALRQRPLLRDQQQAEIYLNEQVAPAFQKLQNEIEQFDQQTLHPLLKVPFAERDPKVVSTVQAEITGYLSEIEEQLARLDGMPRLGEDGRPNLQLMQFSVILDALHQREDYLQEAENRLRNDKTITDAEFESLRKP